MIPITAVDALLRAYHRPLDPVSLPLGKAMDLILREDIRSDRPYPPLDRVCMDGIAIRGQDWAKGMRRFVVAGMARAGAPRMALGPSAGCVEVATGAPCPDGADAVIPYERLRLENGVAEVMEGCPFRPGWNVCAMGTDCESDAILVRKGKPLTPPGIGAAASVGAARVLVNPRPRLALIGTGDELVEIGKRPQPFQLRRSNPEALEALFHGMAEVRKLHAGDDPSDQVRVIGRALEDSDILVLTGGVSAGRFDAAPAALKSAGVREVFHKAAIRPGKPLWFGIAAGEKPVFALPGNPVSSLLCARRFTVPLVLAQGGFREIPPRGKVRLVADVPLSADLTHLIPVRITEVSKGRKFAHPVSIRGSGDFAGLVHSDGFIEVPKGGCKGFAGQPVEFVPWTPRGKAAA